MIDTDSLSKKKRFGNLTTEEQFFLRKTFPWINSLQEGVYCLRENIETIPLCKYKDCSMPAIFNRNGYTKGCGKSHNTKLTNLEKYGCENVKQNKKIIEKAKETYHSKSDEEKKIIQHKKEKAMLKKYGVSNPSYSEKIKKKISKKNKANATTRMIKLKENNQKKYGVDNVFQLDKTKEKSKKTLKEKYGFENPSQSEEIKLKKEETCLTHDGVRNPQQDDKIYEKTNC